jgi:hypothetical protein
MCDGGNGMFKVTTVQLREEGVGERDAHRKVIQFGHPPFGHAGDIEITLLFCKNGSDTRCLPLILERCGTWDMVSYSQVPSPGCGLNLAPSCGTRDNEIRGVQLTSRFYRAGHIWLA